MDPGRPRCAPGGGWCRRCGRAGAGRRCPRHLQGGARCELALMGGRAPHQYAAGRIIRRQPPPSLPARDERPLQRNCKALNTLRPVLWMSCRRTSTRVSGWSAAPVPELCSMLSCCTRRGVTRCGFCRDRHMRGRGRVSARPTAGLQPWHGQHGDTPAEAMASMVSGSSPASGAHAMDRSGFRCFGSDRGGCIDASGRRLPR